METALVKYTPSMVLSGGDLLKKSMVEVPIFENNEMELNLLNEVVQYRRVGMLDKCNQMKRRLAGYRLKQVGLQLLLENKVGEDIRLFGIDERGSTQIGTFIKKKMSNCKMNIPMKFIEKLPNGAAKKLFIFEEERHADPIAAYPLEEKNMYLALFEWR